MQYAQVKRTAIRAAQLLITLLKKNYRVFQLGSKHRVSQKLALGCKYAQKIEPVVPYTKILRWTDTMDILCQLHFISVVVKSNYLMDLESGRFVHQTSTTSEIKLNIAKSVASVCRLLICNLVTCWHAFNKFHSQLSMSVVHGCKSRQAPREDEMRLHNHCCDSQMVCVI